MSYRPFATSSPSPDDDIELLPDEDLSPVSEQANGRGLHAMAFDEDESVIGLTNEYDDMVEQIHALDLDTEAHMVTINNIKGMLLGTDLFEKPIRSVHPFMGKLLSL